MRGVGKAGVAGPLRVGEFRALWSAEAVSVLGDQLARVALAILVFDRTSSAALTALTYALTFLPSVLGGLLLSGLADRFSRKRVIVVTDVLRAGLAAAMAVPGMPLWLLWVLIALLTMAAAPFKAAQLALLPQILDGEQYQAGLAVRQMTIQVAQVGGFGFGGLLVTVLHPGGSLLADAVTFAASALIVALGVKPRDPASPSKKVERKTGARFDGRLAAPFALGGLVGLLVVPEGIAAPYADAIRSGIVGVGILMAADPIGSVIGAWLTTRSATAATPTRRAVVVPAVLSGVPLIACAVLPGIVTAFVLWAVTGALSTIYLIRLQPMIVALVPDERRGAVMGRYSTCLYTGQGVAVLAGGLVAGRTGPIAAVALAGAAAVVLISGVAVAWRFTRAESEDAATGSPESRSDVLVAHDDLLPEGPAIGEAKAAEQQLRSPGETEVRSL